MTANCRLDECDAAARARGLCNKHYKAESKAGRRAVHPIAVRSLTYKQAHQRVARRHGPASLYRCVTCGGPAEEWSYRGGAPDERRSENGWRFSGDPAFYEPRCIACHRRFDGLENACMSGHEFTPENTYEWNGRRFCRQCRNRSARDSWARRTA